MPVPVSVTGWNSKPAAAVAPTIINDEGGSGSFWGKFAAGAAAEPAKPVETPKPAAASSVPTAMEVDRKTPNVVVTDMEFRYPGPDGHPIEGPPMISGKAKSVAGEVEDIVRR